MNTQKPASGQKNPEPSESSKRLKNAKHSENSESEQRPLTEKPASEEHLSNRNPSKKPLNQKQAASTVSVSKTGASKTELKKKEKIGQKANLKKEDSSRQETEAKTPQGRTKPKRGIRVWKKIGVFFLLLAGGLIGGTVSTVFLTGNLPFLSKARTVNTKAILETSQQNTKDLADLKNRISLLSAELLTRQEAQSQPDMEALSEQKEAYHRLENRFVAQMEVLKQEKEALLQTQKALIKLKENLTEVKKDLVQTQESLTEKIKALGKLPPQIKTQSEAKDTITAYLSGQTMKTAHLTERLAALEQKYKEIGSDLKASLEAYLEKQKDSSSFSPEAFQQVINHQNSLEEHLKSLTQQVQSLTQNTLPLKEQATQQKARQNFLRFQQVFSQGLPYAKALTPIEPFVRKMLSAKEQRALSHFAIQGLPSREALKAGFPEQKLQKALPRQASLSFFKKWMHSVVTLEKIIENPKTDSERIIAIKQALKRDKLKTAWKIGKTLSPEIKTIASNWLQEMTSYFLAKESLAMLQFSPEISTAGSSSFPVSGGRQKKETGTSPSLGKKLSGSGLIDRDALNQNSSKQEKGSRRQASQFFKENSGEEQSSFKEN